MKKVEIVIDGVSTDITKYVCGLASCCECGEREAEKDLEAMRQGDMSYDEDQEAFDKEMIVAGLTIEDLLNPVMFPNN